jgi:hypothetical protein
MSLRLDMCYTDPWFSSSLTSIAARADFCLRGLFAFCGDLWYTWPMASVEQMERQRNGVGRDPLLVHSFPKGLPWRVSGNLDHPLPGDIALCGIRKQNTHDEGLRATANCVVCAALKASRG